MTKIAESEKEYMLLFFKDFNNILKTLKNNIPIELYYVTLEYFGRELITTFWQDKYYDLYDAVLKETKKTGEKLDNINKRIDKVIKK